MLSSGLLGSEMQIQEDLTFGFDLGIASCGWAVIRGGDGAGEIVALGTWMFDAPETAKERTPTNQLRRQARGMRRVLKRRRQRMNAIRTLFKAHGLIEGDGKGALRIARLDPWDLRAKGLDRKLAGPELALALGLEFGRPLGVWVFLPFGLAFELGAEGFEQRDVFGIEGVCAGPKRARPAVARA